MYIYLAGTADYVIRRRLDTETPGLESIHCMIDSLYEYLAF